MSSDIVLSRIQRSGRRENTVLSPILSIGYDSIRSSAQRENTVVNKATMCPEIKRYVNYGPIPKGQGFGKETTGTVKGELTTNYDGSRFQSQASRTCRNSR